MLNYEWENPNPNPNPNPSSSIMFNGNGGAGGGLEELISQSIQPNRISDHHHHQQQHSHSFNDATIVTPPIINPHDFFFQQYHYRMLNNPNFHDCVIYPPSPSSSSSPVQLSLEIDQSGTFVLMPKLEVVVPYGCNIDFSNSLNLYFSPEEDDYTVNYNHRGRRSRSMEVGVMMHSPKCQIEGCNADLSHARHYHRRHKVCEFHSKAATVVTGGLAQRYCQQCSRFHILSEFDEGKRSCRKRLADHNRRRRKLSHNEASDLINNQP